MKYRKLRSTDKIRGTDQLTCKEKPDIQDQFQNGTIFGEGFCLISELSAVSPDIGKKIKDTLWNRGYTFRRAVS